MRSTVRPTHALHNLGRDAKPGDHQISTCKRCEMGIFNRQPREWQRSPRIGLVHVDCDNPYGDTP